MLIRDWWGKTTHINLNFLTSVTKEHGAKADAACLGDLLFPEALLTDGHTAAGDTLWPGWPPQAEKALKTCLSSISLTWGFTAKSPRIYSCLKGFQLSRFWSLKQHQTGHLLSRGEKQQKCLGTQAQALLTFWRSRWRDHHISKH